MSVRQCLGAWLAALVVVGAALALLIHYTPPRPAPFHGEQIAVVGSSMIAHAIPPRGAGADSLLGDGRSHRRVARNGMSELAMIAVTEQALDSGAELLLIEVDPFIKTLHAVAASAERCGDRATGFRGVVWRARKQIVDRARAAIGARKGEGWIVEPPILDQPQTILPSAVAATYPVVLHEPACGERLAELTRRARREGVEVVLILPPRSTFSSRMLGPAQERELRLRAARLADRLDVPLFAPQGQWPASQFSDHAHLNLAGRAHFIAELRQWWANRK